MKKAIVFISCGQRDAREKKIGNKLVKYFDERKFDTYYAENIHNSKPLLQSILNSLKDADYLVIYNPARSTSTAGSLFVQQELAVAAANNIETLYFFEKGVDKQEGMSGALHLNGIEISSMTQLTRQLNKLTKTWKKRSRNQLFLKLGNPSLNVKTQNDVLTNWWHITCENGSAYKLAKNCLAYIESIRDITNKKAVKIPYKCEIVWAGVGMHTITILKKSKRDFDAIFTVHGSANWQPQFIQTSTIYMYPLLSDGRYRIVYLVVSDNFLDARLSVDLELKNDLVRIIKQKRI